ncbi:MAG TPA: 5'/3'-nucleotidase SurE [Acidimicrobiales bacterium]|nr:5'/3'-nucleotidase SurE [Acidimicrobiales bacterium]
MRLLVTNDDGIRAPGIAALAGALVGAGHEVVVAAPEDDRSGAGAAIGGMHADESIALRPVELEGLEAATCYAVAASPALITIAACLGAFGTAPDAVVSGINAGANTGRAVLHSGTVGAALTAANFGRSGLAVSLAVGGEPQWATPAQAAVAALEWLARQPDATVVNFNLPNRSLAEVGGVRQGFLAPFGTVRAAIVEASAGLQVELVGDGDGGEGSGEAAPDGSDTALVRAGFASVTVLSGVVAVDSPGAAEAVERRLPVGTG